MTKRWGLCVALALLLSALVGCSSPNAEKNPAGKQEGDASSLWPFGPAGWICKHMYPSAYTEIEKRLWSTLGGCRRR